MKKLLLTFGIICGAFLMASAQQVPTVNWNTGKVLGWGNTSKNDNTSGRAECVDKDGNFYVAVNIINTSIGATNRILNLQTDSVVLATNQTAIVLSKFDSTGLLLWKITGISVEKTPSSNPLEAIDIIAANNGKVYFTFQFIDTITFGTTTILDKKVAASNKSDVVLMEIDGSNGTINWHKTVINDFNSNEAMVTNEFTTAIDFNTNGQIVFLLVADSMYLNTYETNGNLAQKSATHLGSAYLSLTGFSAYGPNVIISGSMMNSFQFGSTNFDKNVGESFILSLTHNGTLNWIRQIMSKRGPSSFGAHIDHISQNTSGTILFTGGFWGTCKITNSTDSLVAAADKRNSGGDNGEELFYGKVSSTGAVLWFKQANGLSSHTGRRIIEMANKNILLLAQIGSRSFYIGADSMPSPSSSSTQRYGLVYFDSTGAIIWAKRVNESGAISKKQVNIYSDAVSNIIFTCGNGAFSNVTFPSVTPMQEYGLFMFLKSGDAVVGPVNPPTGIQNINVNNLTIYPNPASSVLYLNNPNISKNCQLIIRDIQGKVVLQKMINSGENSIDLSTIKEGFYILLMDVEGVVSTQKFIKQ